MNQSDTDYTQRSWKFSVRREETHLGTVCVTGDCDSLGNWSPKNLIPLSYDENSKIWSIILNIPSNRDVRYRYYSCIIDDTDGLPKTMIYQWETNFQPRMVKQNQIYKDSEENIDLFGIFEGCEKIENGWLTNEIVIEMRLTNNSIQWLSSKNVDKKINVKLKRSFHDRYFDCNAKNEKSDIPIWISMSNENGKFRIQNADGYSYNDLDYIIFMTKTFSLDQQGFVFEFIDNSDNEIKKYYSYLVFENKLHGSNGQIRIPIHSTDHQYLGSVNVKYLIIRPMPDVNCSFSVSYAKYWNNSWTGLEIGHRGAGVSFGNAIENNARLRENTIGSFKSAVQNGAHLIEFDVQLTNDLVPTIYHDFHVLLEVQNKMEKPKRKMIFPFHRLNYEELKDFKVHHLKEINGSFSFENDDQEDYSPFPSLEQVLHAVDQGIGFNIEIKYNSELQDGSHEYDHPIDMNEYVDRILQVVQAHAGRRYVVFSSFSPGICVMARLKQNKYPVMFLTQGMTKRYPPYSDQRMNTIQNAIHFANSADLLGIVAHSESLLSDNELVKQILNNNLVLFCWGDDNNDNNNIAKLKEQGVHGIIFDRIDKLGQKLKKDVFQNGIP